ncbi:MAG: substrate-binding domain-containing protein [Candidatus Promineifilaceae bacterium]|nr:substrate-binding domain-containing protein [Candidatus Promineifilaceae bacterium]
MIAYERQQTILRLLHDRPGIKTTEIAEILDVSRGTIRTDLLTLEEQNRVRRVRGGAVLVGEVESEIKVETPVAKDIPENIDGKQRIARWASELVDDGDAILLGAGTTVCQMIPHLALRRDLTVVTNGLDTARLLKQQTDHLVILLGGVVLDRGNATGGLLNNDVLQNLNIHTAFLSGSGFTKETRITERTLDEAELKKRILGRSMKTAILMDGSKLGKAGRFPFAGLEDISHFYTDSEVSAELKEQMRAAEVNLMICGKDTVRSHMVSDGQPHYTIGFANQSEELPFAIDVRRGLERAVAERKNIDLVTADNKLSGAEALRVADKLIARDVDLVIEYQIDYNVGGSIMDKFQQANIPAIAVDIPMVGATFFGVDNYRAGKIGGEALGHWLEREWDGLYDKALVLEESRAGTLIGSRIQGQLEGLAEVLGEIPQEKLLFLDSGNNSTISAANVTKALQEMPDCRRIAVICFNTDAAIGALRAARSLDREQDVAIVGQGADRFLLDEIRRPGSRIVGSTAYMPEGYGPQLLELALQILAGEPVPPAVYTDHVFLDAENIATYYPDN